MVSKALLNMKLEEINENIGEEDDERESAYK